VAARERLVDDADERGAFVVGRCEAAPAHDGRAGRLELAGRDDEVVGEGAAVGRRRGSPIDAEV
jgi:hypothetical protein